MNRHLSVFCLTLAGALALGICSADAADLYSGPAYGGGAYSPANSWTGFYAGVNGGYAFDALGKHGGIEDDGGFGGGQIGYNWQGALGLSRMLVLGIEADFEGADIYSSGNGTLRNLSTGVTYPDFHKKSADDFGTVRGRIGLARERMLFYFTGGFAYGEESNSFLNLSNQNFYKAVGTQTGYVLGGGVEYKISPSWSLKAEYQYVDLNKDRPTDSAGGYVITKDTELNTVRGGINFHFNSPLDPLK